MLGEALLHTAIFVVIALSLELACGLMLAVLVDSLRRGRGIVRTAMMIPMLLPPVVAAVIWRLIYNPQFGLLNGTIRALGGNPSGLTWTNGEGGALLSVIAVDIWEWTPFVFLLVSAALQGLPQEPIEAARVDGASRWRVFLDIELPLLRPVLVLAAMLRGMDLIRVFDQVFILTQGGPGFATETISLYIYRTAFRFFDFGYAAAMSLILLVIATVFARGLAKQLRPVARDFA
jgi:multiple sugar transport system permease protein